MQFHSNLVGSYFPIQLWPSPMTVRAASCQREQRQPAAVSHASCHGVSITWFCRASCSPTHHHQRPCAAATAPSTPPRELRSRRSLFIGAEADEARWQVRDNAWEDKKACRERGYSVVQRNVGFERPVFPVRPTKRHALSPSGECAAKVETF